VAVLFVLALIGPTVQANSERSQRRVYPPPGRLVDIGGGQFIHIRTWGSQAADRPTIILDVSASEPSSLWAWVGPALGKHNFVVAYDRPGMAWSLGPSRPRDALSAANALARALDAASIPGPYVVVGHSYGGFSARAFTQTHRDAVVGLVLLDTTHPDGGGGPGFAEFYRLRAWMGHSGLFEVQPPRDDFRELPLKEQAPAFAVSLWTTHLDTSAEELEAWDTSAQQLRALGDLGDLPLLVVGTPSSGAHLDQQRDLAGLSSRGQFVQLSVNHMGMLVRQDEAAATIDAIEEFADSL
jgi:pimeloyl-ACP methyl ester carboxylesterase